MIIAGALPAAVLGSALLSHPVNLQPVNLFAESFARLISVSITPIHHTDGRSHPSVLSKYRRCIDASMHCNHRWGSKIVNYYLTTDHVLFREIFYLVQYHVCTTGGGSCSIYNI